MKIVKATKRNQKPIDSDVHFKYRCPNSNCSADHWRTLKEVSVKNFKIVCYCGLIIKPKQIKGIKIKYKEDIKLEEKKINSNIPEDLLTKSIEILTNYGFTYEEAGTLIKSSYLDKPTDNCVILIKNTLENIGINYVKSNSSS